MALQAGVGRLEFSGIIVGYVGAVENWDLSLSRSAGEHVMWVHLLIFGPITMLYIVGARVCLVS